MNTYNQKFKRLLWVHTAYSLNASNECIQPIVLSLNDSNIKVSTTYSFNRRMSAYIL